MSSDGDLLFEALEKAKKFAPAAPINQIGPMKDLATVGGPDRCGFRPSCSVYGYTAIEEEGPVIGLLMTADRLTRCNVFKGPGPDYTLLPYGKLYDPPSKNLLFDR